MPDQGWKADSVAPADRRTDEERLAALQSTTGWTPPPEAIEKLKQKVKRNVKKGKRHA